MKLHSNTRKFIHKSYINALCFRLLFAFVLHEQKIWISLWKEMKVLFKINIMRV